MAGLLDRMRRKTDDRVFAEDRSSGVRRHVVLAEVDTVCLYRQRDIDSIIDDYLHAMEPRDIDRFRRRFIKISRARIFFAQLYDLRAAGDQAFHLFGMRDPGKTDVGDRVDSR